MKGASFQCCFATIIKNSISSFEWKNISSSGTLLYATIWSLLIDIKLFFFCLFQSCQVSHSSLSERRRRRKEKLSNNLRVYWVRVCSWHFAIDLHKSERMICYEKIRQTGENCVAWLELARTFWCMYKFRSLMQTKSDSICLEVARFCLRWIEENIVEAEN